MSGIYNVTTIIKKINRSHHGMALLDELVHVSAGQSSLEKHHHVFDHVLVRDVLQERGQGFLGLRPEEIELHHLQKIKIKVHAYMHVLY